MRGQAAKEDIMAARHWDDGDWEVNDDDRVMPDGSTFARAGSALRAETHGNPRNLPCPTCGQENQLTPADRQRGYQCDQCADRDELGW